MIKDRTLLDHQLRWGVIDHRLHPIYYLPVNVRILIYADFGSAFTGGPFGGLDHVIRTLRYDPFYWVRFTVTKASRVNDPSADADFRNKRFDQINLANYDQIWLFGFAGGASVLTPAELTALRSFMDVQGGGVLITGDHEALGAAIGRAVPRAGQMRKWDGAPSQTGPDRHSTLQEGHDAGYQFNDQSDDVPQPLRLKRYFLSGDSFFNARFRPHELLCGTDGPINVFPDHMHEGEALAPTALDPTLWRKNASGTVVAPEVIAWGRIVQPNLDKSGTEFGVVSVYNGHQVQEGTFTNVGRIVADSTWHHWFDINLIGVEGSLTSDDQGFPVSTSGQSVLKKIESYFLNVAIWLAPKAKQRAMRNRLFWGVVWRDPIFMTSPKVPIQILGKTAIDALGHYAPQCTIYRMILESIQIEKPQFALTLERLTANELMALPSFDEFVMGIGIQRLLSLMHDKQLFFRDEFDEQAVDELVEESFKPAAREGLQLSARFIQTLARQSETLLIDF
jgi:hypothetical protein